ncbi:MAG: hypothetical protein OXU51_18055 [Candidatus Poribacteria bacterium]|nr:hypothetical protein [Candidatus Poribacteria bacterium]
MKNLLILFTCLLSLSLFFSCEETQNPIAEEEPFIPTLDIKEVSKTEEEWIPLSDDYLAELSELEIPIDWYREENPKKRQKYAHAQMLTQFGDILPVRVIIEFELNTTEGIILYKLDKYIAYFEAYYELWPNEDTLRSLEELKKQQETDNHR